jgi:hypothetical protein
MNGSQITSSREVSNLPTQWHLQGTGDFNGDGTSDILLRHDSGQIYLWEMNGSQVTSAQEVSNLPNDWQIQATNDFTGDGKTDILLRHDSGQIYLWEMNGSQVVASQAIDDGIVIPNQWHIVNDTENAIGSVFGDALV